MTGTWSKTSWRNHEALQMPVYADQAKLAEVTGKLASYPPLVFAGEARRLKAELASVVDRKAFLLQGADRGQGRHRAALLPGRHHHRV